MAAIKADLLTAGEAIKRLGIGKSTFYRMIERDAFPNGMIVRFGRMVRVRRAILERFIRGEEDAA